MAIIFKQMLDPVKVPEFLVPLLASPKSLSLAGDTLYRPHVLISKVYGEYPENQFFVLATNQKSAFSMTFGTEMSLFSASTISRLKV